MAKFQASLTDGPQIDTNKPTKSLMSMATYAVGAGATIFLIGIGSRLVAPTLDGITAALTGGKVSSGDSTSSDGLGGIWSDI